ncbi:MAG: hypothetical protein PHG85_05440 [Candidatus Altiarchaeota archaeon]|nr:hypothetical protein [Candidatus Altiarchaeota archaeon]
MKTNPGAKKKLAATSTDTTVSIFTKTCIALLTLFFLYSGGEITAFIAVLITLAASYRISRYLINEISLEKVFFTTIGLYFTLVSIYGFIMSFLGLKLSPFIFLIASIIVLIAVFLLTKDSKPCKVNITRYRTILSLGAFLIAFGVYLWPSLPGFVSPCTFGFDCTLHMDYMDNIYKLQAAVPPIKDWRWYPNGFHINGALLSHAIETDMPTYSTFAYPFTAFIAALMVGMLAGMIYDRLSSSLYTLLFLFAILAAVYPASALIGFGFWANLFGMYYAILFASLLPEFEQNPGRRTLGILALITFGSIIAYQILTTLILILSFMIACLSLANNTWANKAKLLTAFIIITGVLYGIYTIEGYSRYLGYTEQPISTEKYFGDKLPKGGFDTQKNGTIFQMTVKGLHVEETIPPFGVSIKRLLSSGLSAEKFNAYMEIGKENIRGPSGNALYYDIKWFGCLTLVLAAIGLIASYAKRDYTLVFAEASIIHLFIFAVGMEMQSVNLYYYSKMMYYIIYPVTLYAVVGIAEIASLLKSAKKISIASAIIMLILFSYGLNLYNEAAATILIGQRTDLYKDGAFWPLLEFNRFLRCWDMNHGIKREAYGFKGWMEMINMTKPSVAIESLPDAGETTFEAAGGKILHSIGQQTGDSDWTAPAGGGYQYMAYGPYIELGPGNYNAVYVLKIDASTNPDQLIGALDVSQNSGFEVITSKELYGKDFPQINEYKEFNMPFSLTNPAKMVELRVHFPNSTVSLTLDKIVLKTKK